MADRGEWRSRICADPKKWERQEDDDMLMCYAILLYSGLIVHDTTNCA